jgi:GT2 family glycosyltransferase
VRRKGLSGMVAAPSRGHPLRQHEAMRTQRGRTVPMPEAGYADTSRSGTSPYPERSVVCRPATDSSCRALAGHDGQAGQRSLVMSTYLVVVLYNCERVLPRFLDSLIAQTRRDWHLIAVDNASVDRSLDIIARLNDERITIIRNRTNAGFAKAANQGTLYAATKGGDFFVLLNADTEFNPDFLGDLLDVRERSRAQVIAPRIMKLDDPNKTWYAGGHFADSWVFANIHEEYDAADLRKTRIVDFATGCCLGLTRGVLERIGLFDERFFVYWEDTDLCLRLKRSGTPIVYTNEPSLLHAGSASSGGAGTAEFNKLYYNSYGKFLRKHFGIFGALLGLARLLARELERPNRDHRRISQMTRAMLKGVTCPFLGSRCLAAMLSRHIERPQDMAVFDNCCNGS